MTRSSVGVALEQLIAESEEALVREAVVLQHDRSLDLPKDAVEPGGEPPLEADVAFGEVARHLAGPVDRLDHRARLLAAEPLLLVPGTRAIGDQEEPLRASPADPIEDEPRSFRPLEDDQRDRRLQLVLRGHRCLSRSRMRGRIGSGTCSSRLPPNLRSGPPSQ